MSLPDFINEAAEYLKHQGVPDEIEAAVILGSGLGGFVAQLEGAKQFAYASIPHFPDTTVEGHHGTLISGQIEDNNVIAFSGRFHRYEGVTFEQTALIVYLAFALKVNKLIISNAVGAVNANYNVGDLVIADSILRQNLAISPRKYGVNRYNHHKAIDKTIEIAEKAAISICRGTFVFSPGPNYETKAEVKAFRKMGGDTVGMSTAPELFEASRLGLKTVAVSLVTNMASGVGNGRLNHDEVKKAAETKKDEFAKLVKLLIQNL